MAAAASMVRLLRRVTAIASTILVRAVVATL
eukprot:CAMPEP_0178489402 /NCGR_PEP_ID=MMETSP0696-20121128/10357_1 /TAXON_ID=265572 /ORGANISM="Extubocellulus spinifer, Strain CCMP396" /LENGTH=30 /DNA_ID= /DNA_START= /DNA_END= /DNA_ORIENTATION=